MKKGLSFALAAGLTFSFAIPSAFAQNQASQQEQLNKMEVVQKDWNQSKNVPNFLSGKLSTKKVKNLDDVKTFLKENQGIFKIDPDRDLSLVQENTDSLGMKHYVFMQTVNGVNIEGTKFMVHVDKDNNIVATNGNLHPHAFTEMNQKVKPDINEQNAIDLAWKHINLTKNDTFMKEEKFPIPEKKSNVENTVEKSNLVIYEKDGQHYLTYKVQLQFIKPYGANWQIYVNAKDGSIVDSYNAVADGATTGYGYGVLNDYKALNTYYSNSTYYLYDVTKPMNGVIETFTAQNGSSLPGSYSVDSNDAWTAYSQGADVDAEYYAGTVYDYYKNTFNRNSFDGNGATIRSTVHYSTNYNNAFWNGSQMVYGDGDGTTFIPLSGGLDVVGHELTHAVTDYTAGLDYRDQSGALNESISDTFGYFIEPNDYLIGEDVYTPNKSGDALRSLSNPEAYGQPSTMSGYVYTTSDNGGVHTNSGIPNKAAYLTISSIGKTKAEQIYYRALTTYMTSTSNFSNARAALLQSASDLYGYGSSTYNSVANAWSSVGVY